MSRITEELREAMHCTNGYSFARDFSFEECCDRIDASFDRLQAENAKLRELMRDAIYARDDADWASIVSTTIALLFGVEVDG